ncbi:MAG: glycosyltransferase, partial [Candidatus Omnitrophica bacterium]|nr:glycosyltransferase [Candidatus Omnitrophota bacterium]
MSNTLVSINIITCGEGDYIENCLKSILKQTFSRLQIIIIDNSCDPRVQFRISSVCSSATVYAEKHNLYYCAGLNKGISKSAGDFILCLNDDCVLEPSYIHQALASFDEPRVGMVSGKIMRPDRITIDSTGQFLSVFRTARERGYNQRDRGQFKTGGFVFGVTGACAFYRAAMIREISVEGDFFDEDFQMFYEDLDVAWRARKFGWKGYYNPAAVAYHEIGRAP